MSPFWQYDKTPELDALLALRRSRGKGSVDRENLLAALRDGDKRLLARDCDTFRRNHEALPKCEPSSMHMNLPAITLGTAADFEKCGVDICVLDKSIRDLIPWRKGPFNLFGIYVDAEWRSDRKWNRLAPFLPDLSGKTVVDIGCNNGYYLMKLAALGPSVALGIDPVFRFRFQFELMRKYCPLPNLRYWPLGIEHLAWLPGQFDLALCMGVLYHQRSPLDSLRNLKLCLGENSRLILETLVIPGDGETCLSPQATYAKMGNVHFIPTRRTLLGWMRKTGFKQPEIIDENHTSTDEQRLTEYCPPPAQTLADFLMPGDPTRTVEGYPAPLRVIITAQT